MADITKQPLEDWFETSLSQSWDWTVGTVNVNAVPNFTFPAWVTTYIVVNPKNTGIQVAEIDSYDPVAKTLNVTNVTLELWSGYASTTKTHSVTSKVIISNNYENWKHIKEVIETKVNKDVDSTIDDTIKLNFGADSYITTDNDGLDIKFKDGNNAETTLSTLTAWAGADRKVAVSDTDTTAGQLDDKIVASDGIDFTTLNPWTDEQIEIKVDINDTTIHSTESDFGLVVKASDSEAYNWVEDTKYVNSSQLGTLVDPLFTTITLSNTISWSETFSPEFSFTQKTILNIVSNLDKWTSGSPVISHALQYDDWWVWTDIRGVSTSGTNFLTDIYTYLASPDKNFRLRCTNWSTSGIVNNITVDYQVVL